MKGRCALQVEPQGNVQPLTPEFLLRLQQQVGNQAVLKLIRTARHVAKPVTTLQAENVISENGDANGGHRQTWWWLIWEWLLRLFAASLIHRRNDSMNNSQK